MEGVMGGGVEGRVEGGHTQPRHHPQEHLQQGAGSPWLLEAEQLYVKD